MEISVQDLFAALIWILWCSLHSALISISVMGFVKEKLGDNFRFYRLFYNAASIATLIPVVYYSHTIHQDLVFRWEGPLVIAQALLLFVSLYLFLAGGRHYSLAQFLGISQIRTGRGDLSLAENHAFVVSGIHRIIRHPWYLGGILIVWAQDLSALTILSNMVISVYFVIGSVLEERKLVREFGGQYRKYQQTVSMLVPWQWMKGKIVAQGSRGHNLF